MDTLEGTSWDVLISGTGIQQALLALALSRCGKKVLHVDKNDVYGGSEAALSLQEAYKWVEKIESATWRSPFSNASIIRAQSEIATSKLAASRAYNLSLAPTLLYTRSALLPILVSSRAHQQLEFQAVGSWFVYGDQEALDGSGDDGDTPLMKSTLVRVPNGREDIFADRSLTLKAKGSLMKFLRFVAVYEEKVDVWEPCKDMPFPDFLSQHFGLPIASHGPLLALSLTSSSAETTLTGFALPRIARHLRSIGLFGPGFGSVIPKWGGLSEVAQVACRAGAVGGAVYVLSKPVESIDTVGSEDEDVEEIPRPELSQEDISKEVSNAIGASNFKPTDDDSLEAGEKGIKEQSLEELLAAAGYSIGGEERPDPIEPAFAEAETHLADTIEPHRNLSILLGGGDHVTADYVIGTTDDLPEGQSASTTTTSARPRVLPTAISRSVSIVTSSLPALYPPTAEGGVTPAGAVVVFPPGSLKGVSADAPVHIIAHASDTGECPQGSTVLYASIASTDDQAFSVLQEAVKALLSTQQSPDVEVIWTLQYQQDAKDPPSLSDGGGNSHVLCFPSTPLDLAFDDTILDNVKEAWLKVTGNDADGFMKFEDREAVVDEPSEEDE